MADEKDVELQRLRRRVKELEVALKTCNDCKYCKSCIMAAPDGCWEACGRFEAREMGRQEVIDGLKAVRTIHNGNYAPQIDAAIELLEEKTGRWLDIGKFTDIDGNHHEVWMCECCGFITYDDSNFCPSCRARMVNENE